MASPNDFAAITTAILHQTTDDNVIVPMLVGAGLESNWRISAPGGGAFQIIDRARPIVSATAAQLGFTSQIDLDVAYMLPRYQAAAAAHASDKASADKYANIAHDAERPALPYQQSQGEPKVQAVYQTVLTNYGMAGANATAPINTVIGGNIGLGFLDPFVHFIGDLTDIRLWRSLGWILLGLLVFIAGVFLFLKKQAKGAIRDLI